MSEELGKRGIEVTQDNKLKISADKLDTYLQSKLGADKQKIAAAAAQIQEEIARINDRNLPAKGLRNVANSGSIESMMERVIRGTQEAQNTLQRTSALPTIQAIPVSTPSAPPEKGGTNTSPTGGLSNISRYAGGNARQEILSKI